MEFEKYYTYEDEYKIKISINEALEKIYYIFSKYNKHLILTFIRHFLKEIGIDNTKENIKNIQTKHFNIEFNHYFIHKRALHLFSQVFLSFDNYNTNDKSEVINPIDTCQLFLLANSILDKAEGDDLDSNIKLFFNSYKFSNDLISASDVQNIYFFYNKIYNELEKSPHYNKFNSLCSNRLGISIKDFSNILYSTANREKKIDLKFLKTNFSINFDDTYNYWQNRKPEIKIPFEYRILQEKPVILYNNNIYPICSFDFMLLGIAKKIYHTLRGLEPDLFGNQFGEVAHRVIIEYLEQSFNNPSAKILNIKFKDSEFADFGVLLNNVIYLFEIKTGLINLKTRYGSEVNSFQEEFDKKFVNIKGVSQQVKRIMELDLNFKYFCEKNALNENLKYQIIPILLFLDEDLFAAGLNYYLGQRFIGKLKTQNYSFKKIIAPSCNSSITLSELRYSIIKNDNHEKTLNSIYQYNSLFYKRSVSCLCYESFLLNPNFNCLI